MNLEVIKNDRPFRKGTVQVIRSANQATDFYLSNLKTVIKELRF